MDLHPETIISLCTGYGGLELGLEIAGMALFPLAYVERESYAAADLVARMEDASIYPAPIWDCVDTFDAKPLHGAVDGVVGGYPCQPFSVAGQKRGAEDERHLWPQFARIVRECEPRWCFFENVSNHLNLGFFEVARELQEMGYTVAAAVVTAEEVGAPHKRERLFILAHAGGELKRDESRRGIGARGENTAELDDSRPKALADNNGNGLQAERGQKAGRCDLDGCSGEAMAHADSDGRGQQVEIGKAVTIGDCQVLAHAKDKRRKAGTLRSGVAEEIAEANDVWPCFPPGQDPNDPRWESWPWPSVESEIRKRLDGHPYWVDELRLNGGGVVPLQAAYAFSLLTADLWRFGA